MVDSSMSDAQLLRRGGHSARSLGSGCMADPSVLQSRGAHVRSGPSLASDSAADGSSRRRREEIRLGKRPVDSTIGASFCESNRCVDWTAPSRRLSVSASGGLVLPAYEAVGAPGVFRKSSVCAVHSFGTRPIFARPRVVPLRTVGSLYRPVPLVLPTPIMEPQDIIRARCEWRLIRSYRSGRKRVRGG